MWRNARAAALAFAVTLLVGCASLGLAPPKTLSERISYAYGNVTAVRITATTALNARQISADDATYVLEVTDRTRSLIDASRLALETGDPTTAEGRLFLAIQVLDQLQVYLSKRLAS